MTENKSIPFYIFKGGGKYFFFLWLKWEFYFENLSSVEANVQKQQSIKSFVPRPPFPPCFFVKVVFLNKLLTAPQGQRAEAARVHRRHEGAAAVIHLTERRGNTPPSERHAGPRWQSDDVGRDGSDEVSWAAPPPLQEDEDFLNPAGHLGVW